MGPVSVNTRLKKFDGLVVITDDIFHFCQGTNTKRWTTHETMYCSHHDQKNAQTDSPQMRQMSNAFA